MDVFSIEGVLEELNDVVVDGVFGGEAFCPGEEFSPVNRGLLDGETESHSEMEVAAGVAKVG